MIIVSSPAANLPPEVIDRYGIALTPQYVVRDSGTLSSNDLHNPSDIDAIVTASKTHPHILGASSGEYVALLRELGGRDAEIIVVAPSRKASGAYDAAVAASRTLQTLPTHRDVKVSVVDSATADMGTGLVTLFCAEAARAGKRRNDIAQAASVFAKSGKLGLVPTSFDYLTKSGRASFLKSMVANLLQKVPVIGVESGELKPVGTIDKRASMPSAIMDYLVRELGPGRRVWAAVGQAHNPEVARELAGMLRSTFDIAFFMERTIAPGIYLNIGPGVAATVYPVDAMPWNLAPPS